MKIIFSLLLLFYSILSAETSIWKVQKDADTIYVGGTVHLLRKDDYPLPKEFDKAYNLSNKIYFETDLSSLNSLDMQKQLLSKMFLEKGQTLSTILRKDVYQRLEKYCQKYSLNIKDFEYSKPIMPILILTITELQNLGVSEVGVDDYFENRAIMDGKDIGQLESVNKQIEYLFSIGEGTENQFVSQSLDDLDKTQVAFSNIVSSWRKGENKELYKLYSKDMKKNYPKVYNKLIVERNNNWMPIIKSMFKNDKKEFVLVGVAHLVGKEGIIEQLKKSGYKVEKFK